MARRHKRSRPSSSQGEQPNKRARLHEREVNIKHPTLCMFYAQILTLRDHLLANLPKNSKLRRRKVATSRNDILDKTLVCQTNAPKLGLEISRDEDFEAFTQKLNATSTSSAGTQSVCQSDLVDFVIWHLFHRIYRYVDEPNHMLCRGFRRVNGKKKSHADLCALGGIPGIVSHYPNENVNYLKNAEWLEILDLLGHGGSRIMLDLLLDYGLYVEVEGGRGNYYQLSGALVASVAGLQLMVTRRHAADRTEINQSLDFDQYTKNAKDAQFPGSTQNCTNETESPYSDYIRPQTNVLCTCCIECQRSSHIWTSTYP